jgi:hypothetical protein
MKALRLAALAVAMGSFSTASAEVAGGAAAPEPQAGTASADAKAPVERKGLNLILNAGVYDGIGAGVGFTDGGLGVSVSAGWTPYLIVFKNGSDLKFYSGFQLSPDLYARVLKPQPSSEIGATVGYRYSSLLGNGVAFGGYAQFQLSRAVDVHILAGLMIFPDGEDKLKQDQNLASTTQFSFPGPNVNFAVSVGFVFFP